MAVSEERDEDEARGEGAMVRRGRVGGDDITCIRPALDARS